MHLLQRTKRKDGEGDAAKVTAESDGIHGIRRISAGRGERMNFSFCQVIGRRETGHIFTSFFSQLGLLFSLSLFLLQLHVIALPIVRCENERVNDGTGSQGKDFLRLIFLLSCYILCLTLLRYSAAFQFLSPSFHTQKHARRQAGVAWTSSSSRLPLCRLPECGILCMLS